MVSEAPLSNILNNPNATGRVSMWGIEVAPHDLTYVKATSIKSQVLPDFITEWIEVQTPGPLDLSNA